FGSCSGRATAGFGWAVKNEWIAKRSMTSTPISTTSALKINDINPKVIPTGIDSTLDVFGMGFHSNFSGKVRVGAAVYPIYAGPQIKFIDSGHVQFIVKIGSSTTSP